MRVLQGRRVVWPELECVRHLVSADVIEFTARRARELRVPAERVLVASGAIAEDDYWMALAEAAGIGFDRLLTQHRDDCALSDEMLIRAPAAGLLELRRDDSRLFFIAPKDARQLLAYLDARPQLRNYLRLTTPRHLAEFVRRVAPDAVAEIACNLLPTRFPEMSAAPQPFSADWKLVSGGVALVAALIFAQQQTLLAIDITLLSIFLGWIVLRLFGMFMRPPGRKQSRAIRLQDLPTYSIIVALYREAASVQRLVYALQRLDYPREKLNIKLVLEADDRETRAALAQIALGPEFQVIIAPDIGPRTKPKALNIALPFVRGAFVAVYDAEDRPEPDQLLRALAAFQNGPRRLACVQARLTIDNTNDSWLAGIYTAEYAAQFDVFLPALAALSAPLPLGGTSNHFRTDALREVGGWDSYNVTEDADLGLRLARFGFDCDVIDSATYEEAPARFAPWLRQRTRWFKGWIRTWCVHMRQPLRLLRELGPFSFLIFQLSFGGNVLAALVHPFFILALVRAVVTDTPLFHGDEVVVAVMTGLFGTAAAIGYAASAILNGVGLVRRGLFSTLWVVALTPLHWLMLSLAAWRALYQLMREPYLWEKTEHGLARTSRRRQRVLDTLGQLERQLRGNNT